MRVCLLLVLVSGCRVGAGEHVEDYGRAHINPTELRPDTVFTLPKSLKEISGLTLLPDGLIGAVQDEDGDLFGIDTDTGEIVYRIRFADDGDYEGVAMAEGRVIVLESDGKLFQLSVPNGDESRIRSRRSPTGLHESCDAEGLDYDPAGTRLLIVCKEVPGRRMGRVRAVYEVELEVAEDGLDFEKARLAFTLPIPEGRKRSEFKPAAIAVTPTRAVLVLSSVSPYMYQYDPSGVLEASWKLPKNLLPQPEGLALDGSRLFVASEAAGDDPTIAVFSLPLP